ncbi:hypothetical protein LCGC14_2628510, partial [marine sediment metagenome]
KFRDRQRAFFNQREGLKQAFKVEFEEKEAPSGSVNAAIDAYFDVNIDDYPDPRNPGETDWDAFFGAQDKALVPLSAKDRKRVVEFIRKFDTPTVKEFRGAQDIIDRFYETPKYKGLSLDDGEDVDRVLFDVAPKMQLAFLRRTGEELSRGDAVMSAVQFVKDEDVAEFLLEHFVPRPKFRVRQRRGRKRISFDIEPEEITNPKRDAILIKNQEIMAKFFPDILMRELSREQEAGLRGQAFAAIQR